jgi:hypothetical protein
MTGAKYGRKEAVWLKMSSWTQPTPESGHLRRASGVLLLSVLAIVAILAIVRFRGSPTRAPTPKLMRSPFPTLTAVPVIGGIALPATIDATGATDASAALISFVNSVPDGSTIGLQDRWRLPDG